MYLTGLIIQHIYLIIDSNMKNKQLFEIKEAIVAVKEKGTNKFKLPLILNEMAIDGHIKALEELRKPSEDYNKFLQEKRELLAGHAEVDEQGTIILYSGQNGTGQRRHDYGFPNIVKAPKTFETTAKELEEKYKTVLEKESKKQEEFTKTLEENTDIELKKIPFADVPEIEYDYLRILMPMIEV